MFLFPIIFINFNKILIVFVLTQKKKIYDECKSREKINQNKKMQIHTPVYNLLHKKDDICKSTAS
jgi:hypothetical protein